MEQDSAPHAEDQVELDVRLATQPVGGTVVEGTVVDGSEALRGGGGRVHQEQIAPAQAMSQPVAYVAVEASSTTDPHHDQGSSAAGHVEDAMPDTHAAGPAVEESHEIEATPAPEEVVPAHEDVPPPHEEVPQAAPEPVAEHQG